MSISKDKKYRFVPKTYGRGMVPISREWRVVTALIVLVVLWWSQLILWPYEIKNPENILLFLVYISFILLVCFHFLKYVNKTEWRGLFPTLGKRWSLAVVVVTLIIWVIPFVSLPVGGHELARVIWFFVFVWLIAMLSIALTKSRTKGKMRWRWGRKDMDWE